MKKKCILLVVLVLVLFSFQGALAADYTKEAEMLNSMGLFNGTNNGYELNRVPTRVESAAMLVRLLGAEKEANEMKYEHPFTDVPAWANNIVGYMYEKGYTSGIGNNLFGSAQVTIARDYTTFMLRSLGYSSSSDFNYLEALSFAASQGIIATEEVEYLQGIDFKRNEMVMLSYKTLNANLKGSEDKLANKLYENGAINKHVAFEKGLVDKFETVIDGIDSSLNKLEIVTPVLFIYADKQEISSGTVSGFGEERKESFVNGYKGSIGLRYNFPNWKSLNIMYEISFYNDGQFIKKINYLYNNFNIEHDTWREFMTPDDDFDELRISAYPVSAEEINNAVEDILEVISTKDVNVLKNTIKEYNGVHATASDIREFIDVNSNDDINILTLRVIFDRVSIYNDGSVFRPYAHKYTVEGNYTIEFQDEGSAISSDRILYLPKNDMKENIYFILIFDEGYRIAKVFIVK